ncbi:hypothetical protein LWI29_018829 [Acer saccharum]|uniref:Uncharacterized protein n=1 Tax=Acer saccharum TaxID=4024 RepID=A0AA39VNH2_ACESA|nr:hypothetical protein LWI29_018829 [Acer saccharum]
MSINEAGLREGSDGETLEFEEQTKVGNQDDCTFISAYVIFLGMNVISWCSRKQRSIAQSLTKAEYRAVALAVAEVIWLSNLLQELSIVDANPSTIYCENVGTTYLCYNLVFHSRMKHVAIDFHFVRERVQ